MTKKQKTDVIETIEVDNVLDNWDEFDRKYIENEINILKSMTDSQLRNRGKIDNILNYQMMTREELVNALTEYIKEDVEKAYLCPEDDSE